MNILINNFQLIQDMKKLILSIALMVSYSSVFAQRPSIPENFRTISFNVNKDIAKQKMPETQPPLQVNTVSTPLDPDESLIGNTKYDLQTNSMLQGRIYEHPDGTIGATWTRGNDDAGGFTDRGTGYNYFDGTSWGPIPTARIGSETVKCGWPSYVPYGPNGEMVVVHTAANGLLFSKRENKGTGNWTAMPYFTSPSPISPTWPRLAVSGDEGQYLHLIYNSYAAYNDQTYALLYARSSDGGATWDEKDVVFDEFGPNYYSEIGADAYSIVAKGNTVVILISDTWMSDLAYIKSTDNGETWQKTTVWEHPYPFFDWDVTLTDTFFAPDGSASAAIDANGEVHVVFGMCGVQHSAVGTSYSYWPWAEGIGYWNEDMPVFGNDVDALCPPTWGKPNSQMIEDYNWIGYLLETDTTVDYMADDMLYRTIGRCSMPDISIDENNNVFVAFSMLADGYMNDTYNFRHIFVRAYANSVWGDFVDLNTDIIHIFDECIYPVLSPTSDAENIHLIYSADQIPGLALDSDHAYVTNNIYYVAVPKTDLVTIVDPDIDVVPTSMTFIETSPLPADDQSEPSMKDIEDLLRRPSIDPQYLTDTIYDENNHMIIAVKVPGKPPEHYRAPVAENTRYTYLLPNTPAYDWSFGCSATSAAMMAGYYDNNGYPDAYSGPTNGGVAPLTNEVWGSVIINGEVRKQCPISATRYQLDGRTTYGHVDDYWIVYGSDDPDPFIGNWNEHTWGECTGDFMKTNQYNYDNSDGSTTFWFNPDGYPYSGTDYNDGCYGLKLFFESRGYEVINYYTQLIYGYSGNTQGFTFNDYVDEIDAGRPVLIHVEGHTMLGFGYDDNNNTVYLHDTWDYENHTMIWGGDYSGLAQWGVSVIQLATAEPPEDVLTINNVGSGTLTVSSITVSNSWILLSGYPTPPIYLDAGESQQVNVGIDWPQLGGITQTGNIIIGSNDPDEPTVYVPVTAIPLGMPDLVVQNQNVDPSGIAPGGIVTASCDVYNQGTATSGESTLRYYLSTNNTYGSGDIELGSDAVGSLYPGMLSNQEQLLVIPSGTATGIWYILFVADADNQVIESMEDNNVASFMITVQTSSPDLVVQNQNVSPSSVLPGANVNASCLVLNQGNGAAGSSNLKYYLSSNTTFGGGDILLGSDAVNSLGVGQSSSQEQLLTIPSGTATGTWYILFYADADLQVNESNENNNIAYFMITVLASQPDLIVMNQDADPIVLPPGGVTNTSCDIMNQGYGNSTSCNLKYYISLNNTYGTGDIELGSVVVAALGTGQSVEKIHSLTIPGSISAGDWYIRFYIDPENQVAESNDNNNIGYLQIIIQNNIPDLIIQNNEISPLTVEPGDQLNVNYEVKNQGNGASSSTSINYFLSSDNIYDYSDTELGDHALAGLDVGEITVVNDYVEIPGSSAEGNWYILFYVDKDGQVAESNENNNIAFSQFIVSISPTNVELQPGSHEYGTIDMGDCSGEFEFILSNSSAQSASGIVSLNGAGANNFVITEGDGSYSLPSYFSKSIKVKFCPLNAGSISASLEATCNISNTLTAELTGVGAQVDYLSLSNDSVELDPTIGSQQEIIISSNVSWQITGYPTWLDLSMINGTGTATVSITANSANAYDHPRSAVLVVSGDNVSSENLTVIQNALGIKDFSMRRFKVYPIPASHYLYIDGSDLKNKIEIIELISSMGDKIIETETFSNQSTIKLDLGGIAAGSYILRLISGQNVFQKLVLVKQ